MTNARPSFSTRWGSLMGKILIGLAIAIAVLFGKVIGETAVGVMTKVGAQVQSFQKAQETK